VADRRDLMIVSAKPAFGGRENFVEVVDAARKRGFHLLSQEDLRRFRLSRSSQVEAAGGARWAAFDPNSEATSGVVWDDSEEKARDRAIAACRKVSSPSTCTSQPAVTDDMEASFVLLCCSKPRIGCATATTEGDRPLQRVKAILAREKFSQCEVRSAYSARDGKPM
jgi:hypothetical protein